MKGMVLNFVTVIGYVINGIVIKETAPRGQSLDARDKNNI